MKTTKPKRLDFVFDIKPWLQTQPLLQQVALPLWKDRLRTQVFSRRLSEKRQLIAQARKRRIAAWPRTPRIVSPDIWLPHDVQATVVGGPNGQPNMLQLVDNHLDSVLTFFTHNYDENNESNLIDNGGRFYWTPSFDCEYLLDYDWPDDRLLYFYNQAPGYLQPHLATINQSASVGI
ncbi:MAG: hypothetical protein HKM24_06900 [Gammaproteobacteria bacterium]|nr:hypothetical protein [Gammaproteobacteria bacterium]